MSGYATAAENHIFQSSQRRTQGDGCLSCQLSDDKNALPPDPAEAMVLDPACGPSSPIVPHIKFAVTPLSFTVWVSIYCAVKSLLHIVSCSSAYACREFCTPLPLQHSPCVIKWRQNAAYVLLTRLLHVSPAVTSASNVTGIFLWCLRVRVGLSHQFINKNRKVHFLSKLDFFTFQSSLSIYIILHSLNQLLLHLHSVTK